MKASRVKPTDEEQRVASSSLKSISKTLEGVKEEIIAVEVTTKSQGSHQIEIPKKALAVLGEVMELIARGKGFALLSEEEQLSTQEAADLLKVSRPYVVQLLEAGVIPHKMVGTHRRIQLSDLINYVKRSAKDQEEALKELTRQAQELNLGY